MKKNIIAFLSILTLIFASACNNNQVSGITETTADDTKAEIIVFAAASMTETLNQIKPLYENSHNVNIVYNFDSSGTLKTQIENGADCDIFLSAAQKQMNDLENGGYILSNTRTNLLENKVALAVPDDNRADIYSFYDIVSDKLHLMAIGNSDVPVGQYTIDILKFLGTSAEQLEAEGKITYGSNVKEVTTQVSEGAVDCGIIYQTDAYSAGLNVVDTATKDMCNQVIYPVAVLNDTKNEDAAKEFLTYLKSNEAMSIFSSVGFSPAN